MVEEERTPNEVGWEALSPVERDRLTRMRRLLEVGWDNVIKYDEQSGLPPSEQRSWVIGVRGESGEQEGEFIITPEMAMRAAQLGIKIYQQIESDPRLGPHARRLYREAGKKVERDTAERHARNGSPQPNPHERKFRSIINSKNGPTF